MKKLFTFWLLLAALTSRVTLLAYGDAVLDWNQYAATAIVSPPPTGAGKPAGIGLVDLSIVHNAIYDAVNAIAGYPFEPYEVIPTVTMPASSEAAVATAGHSILVALFPAQQTELDTKDLSINNRNNFVVDHVKRVYATSEHRHGSAAALCGIERPAQ